MIIKTLHIILFILLIITGCEYFGSDNNPDNHPYDCMFNVSDSNIIVRISEDQDSLIFFLENNDRIARSKTCVSAYYVDTVNWVVNVKYENGTRQSLPFSGDYFVIHKDSILLNPYQIAPLSALVKFTLPVAGRIKIIIYGRTENSHDITHVFNDFAVHHEIPVYGLYAEYNNTVNICVLDYLGNERISKTIQIQTGELGLIQAGTMQVKTDRYTDEQKSRLFSVQNAIYDAEGYVRWYIDHQGIKFFTLANHLIANQIWPDKGHPITQIIDIRMFNFLGQIVEEFDVPNRNHHEINEKYPGGNLLVGSNAEPYFGIADDTEDMIVEIDRQTGEVVKTWDLRDIFDPTRPRLWTENTNDWCHLNSIEYDSTDNTLLISSKLQYFIAKIDYDTGQIKWIFGNHENWKEPWQKYLLTPVNFNTTLHPDHDWVYAQHMPRVTGDGNIIVYDNGSKRPGGGYTRAFEFRVDEVNMTVEKIWTYDFDFSLWTMGSIHVYDDGNVLIGHGANGDLVEVNRQGDVIFDASLKNYYRAYPIQLY